MLLAIKFRKVIFMQGNSGTELKMKHDRNTFAKKVLLNCEGVNVDENCEGCQSYASRNGWLS